MEQRIRRRVAYFLIALTLFCGVVAIEYVQRMADERAEEVLRSQALSRVAQMRSNIETHLYAILFNSYSITNYVVLHPESTPEQWEKLSIQILSSLPAVQNIVMAPNNIITFVYPSHGHKSVIGMNYREHPERWSMIKLAMDRHQMVLAGPLPLVQGDVALIARMPVYLQGGETFWGTASVIISIDKLLNSAGFHDRDEKMNVAIRGTDGQGRNGGIIAGSPEVFKKPLAEMKITLPYGYWSIVAAASTDRAPDPLSHYMLRLVGYSFLLAVMILLGMLLRLYSRSHKEAMHDALTGLPNRRLMLSRLQHYSLLFERSQNGFALFFIDLNGFKPINDRYGHNAGDAVLKEVGVRLERLVRRSDTVARTGGDEFMVLQPGVESHEDALRIAEKISSALSGTMVYQHNVLNMSASVGVALFPEDTDNVDQLINAADDAMYRVKESFKARQRH